MIFLVTMVIWVVAVFALAKEFAIKSAEAAEHAAADANEKEVSA